MASSIVDNIVHTTQYSDFDGRTTTATGSTQQRRAARQRGMTPARGSRATGGTTTLTVSTTMARGSRATGGMTTGHDDGDGWHDNAARQLGRATRQRRRAAHNCNGPHGDAAGWQQGAAGQQKARRQRQNRGRIDEGSGGVTRKAAAAGGQRLNHATISVGDDEGSRGATMKGAVAPQGRQRLRNKESSGGATMKAEPAARR